MSRILMISIAEDTGGLKPKPVTIGISQKIPVMPSLSAQATYLKREADQIAEALWSSLPQATFNRLVAKLLEMDAGHYVGLMQLRDTMYGELESYIREVGE